MVERGQAPTGATFAYSGQRRTVLLLDVARISGASVGMAERQDKEPVRGIHQSTMARVASWRLQTA